VFPLNTHGPPDVLSVWKLHVAEMQHNCLKLVELQRFCIQCLRSED